MYRVQHDACPLTRQTYNRPLLTGVKGQDPVIGSGCEEHYLQSACELPSGNTAHVRGKGQQLH